MKLLLPVIALAIATPAFAQNAPAGPHAGHTHAATAPLPPAPDTCSPEHAAMGHCKPGQKPSAKPAGQQTIHDHARGCCKKGTSGKMACCKKAHTADKDCCDEQGGAPQGTQPDHSGH